MQVSHIRRMKITKEGIHAKKTHQSGIRHRGQGRDNNAGRKIEETAISRLAESKIQV